MTPRPPRHETALYCLAFLIALGLRFVRLGELPLSDSEARLALDALHIAQGQHPALSSHVAYTSLTAVLFFIFGSFNFLARFWPALFGTALVFAPLLLRDRLTPRPALLLAFFFALDPALVSLSRQAGGPILAVTSSLLAAAFWTRSRPRLAGVFLALALLSGPALWPGLLGLLLAWMLAQFMSARPAPAETESDAAAPENASDASSPVIVPLKTDYRALGAALLATLLAVSTLLFLSPQGLGAWLASLPDYLKGWVSPVSVPVGRLFLALGVYQLLAVPFALIAIGRGWWDGSADAIRLSLWTLVAILLAAFYPARQPADLVWALVPLWTLAALELARHLEFPREDRLEIVGLAALVILLLAFAWMDVEALRWTTIPSREANIRLLLLAGAFVLLIVSAALVGYGWSARVARVGAAWGATILLGVYTLGAAWGATGLRDEKAVELWDLSPRIAQADLLTLTVNQTSEWAVGQTDSLPVLIVGVDSPALTWALRGHNPQNVVALDPASAPELVITPTRDDLGLAAAYRGQDFNWRLYPAWDSFSSYTLGWLAYHDLPTAPETVILWVRADLFIDAEKP